jgi:hypothetical protein
VIWARWPPWPPLRNALDAVLLVALLGRVVGLWWGLPASDGWDDDGIAPRDFLVGVVDTYAWAHHATYPPLQMILLAVATSPVWIAALLRAPSLAPAALVGTFIQVPTMTALAVVARSVTIAMSIGLLWNVAKIGQTLRGSSRAGAWTATWCAACSVFTYYSQTSNLDVPYLFWGVVAVRRLVQAIVAREPRMLRTALGFAALAVCTKDQAYALFLLSVPLAVGAWLLLDPASRRLARSVAMNLAAGAAVAAVLVLVLDGALFNPVGFAARVRFLLGSASQDHATYAASVVGYAHVARDVVLAFGRSFPWTVAPLVVIGLVASWRAADGATRAAGLVPALVAVSFTLAFDLTARRTEDRFVLPQMLMCGVYAGLGCDALQSWLGPGRQAVLAAAVAPAFVPAVFGCMAVDAAMVLDPRYDAERWLRGHVEPDDRLEVYDNNVHLPRLPRGIRAERVDVSPPRTSSRAIRGGSWSRNSGRTSTSSSRGCWPIWGASRRPNKRPPSATPTRARTSTTCTTAASATAASTSRRQRRASGPSSTSTPASIARSGSTSVRAESARRSTPARPWSRGSIGNRAATEACSGRCRCARSRASRRTGPGAVDGRQRRGRRSSPRGAGEKAALSPLRC